MRTHERRQRRSSATSKALQFQMMSCVEDGSIDAMVVADGDGLPLASSGDTYACDEVAARMVLVGPKIQRFAGTLLGDGVQYDVQMQKVSYEGTELLVCAIGGSEAQRARQIARGAEGALRILAA